MRSLIPESHRITPRRPAFDFAHTPSHGIYDDPLVTQMLNVINPITPPRERCLCQTFREALPLLKDEKLKQAAWLLSSRKLLTVMRIHRVSGIVNH